MLKEISFSSQYWVNKDGGLTNISRSAAGCGHDIPCALHLRQAKVADHDLRTVLGIVVKQVLRLLGERGVRHTLAEKHGHTFIQIHSHSHIQTQTHTHKHTHTHICVSVNVHVFPFLSGKCPPNV